MESMNDALIECIKACGGSKVVGAALFPELPPEQAQRSLLDAVNPDTPRAGSMRDASAVLRRRGDAGRKKLRGAVNDREMELEDLITSRSGDVLRLKAKADAAMPEMAKVWRDEARRAAADVGRLVALRTPETVARMEADRGLA